MLNAPIRIYDTTLTLLTEVDGYETFYYTRGFNAPGQFELTINWNLFDLAGFRYSDYFQVKNYIVVNGDYDKVGIITEITKHVDGGGKGSEIVTVRGQEATFLLSQRIVEPPLGSANFELIDDAETVIKTVVASQLGSTASVSRQMAIVNILADQARGGSYTYSSRYRSLIDDVNTISLANSIGYKFSFNPATKKLDFDCYMGVDRTASQTVNQVVIVSTDFDTLKTGDVTDSRVIYKNIAYTAGQGVGEDRTIRKVYDTTEPTGTDRYELFVDARDLDNNTKLDERGAQKLSELSTTEFIDASILSFTQYQLGVDYNVGDYITVSLYGKSTNVQITGIQEVWEFGKYEIQHTYNRTYPEFPTQVYKSTQAIGQILANAEGVKVFDGAIITSRIIKNNLTIPTGCDALSLSSTITIASGVTVDVQGDSIWAINTLAGF